MHDDGRVAQVAPLGGGHVHLGQVVGAPADVVQHVGRAAGSLVRLWFHFGSVGVSLFVV